MINVTQAGFCNDESKVSIVTKEGFEMHEANRMQTDEVYYDEYMERRFKELRDG